MRTLPLLALLVAYPSVLGAAELACVRYSLPPVTTFTVDKLCDGWSAWRVGGNLYVTCPGKTPPRGAVALKPAYVWRGS